MIISVGDTGQCWVCGKDNVEITRHHTLPKHLKPVNNVIVPVCERCHRRINLEDINGMYGYLQVMGTKMKDNEKIIKGAFNLLDELKEMRKNTPSIKTTSKSEVEDEE